MATDPTQEVKTLQACILSGSFVLLSGSGLATVINFAYNIAIARFLGPTGFGHATVVYTLLALVSAVILSLTTEITRKVGILPWQIKHES